MSAKLDIRRYGIGEVPTVQHLWEALFDHHVSIGAAGLPTVARHESWPRRQKHYESLFSTHPVAGVWIASLEDDAVGYAMAYEDNLDGDRVMVLETLSVLASARGHGIGTRLMQAVDEAARTAGITVGVVDVMGGNPRAHELYLRYGYQPYSEAWMCSTPPNPLPTLTSDPGQLAAIADQLGLQFSSYPGPDDTWESANHIVELSTPSLTTWQTSAMAATLSQGSAEKDHDFTELATLIAMLIKAGLWTIRLEVPVGPEALQLRRFLAGQGFQLSTERMMRAL